MAQDKPFNIYDYEKSYYGIPIVNPQERTSPAGRALQGWINSFLPDNKFDYSRGLLQEGLDEYITRGGYFRDQTVSNSNAMLALNNELLMAKTDEDVMDIARRFRNLEKYQNPSPVIPNGIVPQAISSDQFEQQDEYAMKGLLGGNVNQPKPIVTPELPQEISPIVTPELGQKTSPNGTQPPSAVSPPIFDGVTPQDQPKASQSSTQQSKRSVEQEKSFMEKARKKVATDDFRDKLIIGLEGLTHSPNKDLIRSAQKRIDARRADEKLEALKQEDAIKRNKTADYILQATGDEDLARLVADGLISGSDALQEFKSSQAEMKRLTAARDSVIAKSGFVLQAIDKALDIISTAKQPTTGLLGAGFRIFAGSDAKRLDAVLDTIRSNIGFKELNEMRQSSKTGGALGNVTVRELELLQSTMVSLDPDIGADLVPNLLQLKNVFTGVLAKVEASNYEAKRAAGVVPQLESQYSSLQRLV